MPRTASLLLGTLLLATVALPALAPGAEAQALPAQPVPTTLTVLVIDSGRPAVPERPTQVAVRVVYGWGPGGAATDHTPIDLEVTGAPEWALDPHFEEPVVYANLSHSSAFTRRVEVNATLNFTVSAGAQAFQPGNVTVLAKARPNGNLGASQGEGTLTTRPAFVGALNATADPAVVRGGVWSPVGITVRNDGNGPTKVKLEIVTKPEPSEARLPAEVVLQRNETRVLDVELRLPWTTGVDGLLQVKVLGASAQDPLSDPVETTAAATVDGQSAVPGPGWALVAGAAAALAGLRGRARLPP